jgi:ribonuclease D
VLRALYALREEYARASDEPPFRIVNNETLLEIARVRPRSIHDLQQVQGFSWKQSRKMGDAVLEAVRVAVELGPLRKLPSLPSRDGTDDFDDADIELHERLKERRKELAIRLSIDSAYLLNRHLLVRIAREKPRTLEALAQIEGMHAWQVPEFGPALLEVLSTFERELASGVLPKPRRRAPWRG